MKTKAILLNTTACAICLAGIPSTTFAQLDFSLSQASTKVPAPFSAADDIEDSGSVARTPAIDLGVAATNEISGLSYGQAEVADVNTAPYFIKRLAYSVDTTSVGNGAPISSEVATDGAAGDTFALDFVGVGDRRLVLRRPFVLRKAQTRNLTLKPNEDDIDGLSLFRSSKYPVYMTFPPGSGYDPASIYIVTTPGGPPQVFASAGDLGLSGGDVIDAFSLGPVPFGGPPPTALNPNVAIWISLSMGSPSRGGGGDSILQAWPTPRGTVLAWEQLNLATGDEVNALAVLDPGLVEPEDEDAKRGQENQAGDIWFSNWVEEDIGGGMTNFAFDPKAWLEQNPQTYVMTVDFGLDVYGQTCLLSDYTDHYLDGAWPLLDTAELKAATAPVIGNAVPLTVTAAPKFLIAAFQTDADRLSPEPGTELQVGPGTAFARYNDNAGSLDFDWIQFIASSSLEIAALDVLDEQPGEYTLFTCGSVANPGLDFGTLHLDTGLESGSDAYSLYSDLVQTGAQGVVGIQVKGFGRSGPATSEFAQAGAAVVVPLNETDTVARAMVAVSSLAPHLAIYPVTTAGLGERYEFPDVNPLGASSFIYATHLISYEADLISQIIPVTNVDVLPLVPSSFTPPEVSAIEFTPTAAFVAVNSVDSISVQGETYGEDGNPQAFLFKIGLEGALSVQGVFQTDSPAGVMPRISAVKWNRVTDEVGITMNTVQDTTTMEPFSFSFFNAENGSAAGIDFSVEYGQEASFFTIDPETFVLGSTIVDADAGFLNVAANSQVAFTDCVPLGSGFRVFGFALSQPVLHPGNIQIPVIVTGFPWNQERVISFDVSAPANAEPPILLWSVNAQGSLVLDFTGTLQSADSVFGPWTDEVGAINPLIVTNPDVYKYWRTKN